MLCLPRPLRITGWKPESLQQTAGIRLTVDAPCERKVCMKLAAFVFLSTVVCAVAQGESWHSSELKIGDLGDFKLENGAVIRDCRIAYHTSGKLNDDKSNIVLWPTWFTGSSKQLIPLAGSDGYVDPSRYFVIFVDALGNGISSSPSNSSVQPRMEFPVFTIRDMVNSQYRLLTEISASIMFTLSWVFPWGVCKPSSGSFRTPNLWTKRSRLSALRG